MLDVAHENKQLDVLRNVMRKFNVRPMDMGKIYAKSSAFDAPIKDMKAITPLLYQSGYLTIKDYDELKDHKIHDIGALSHDGCDLPWGFEGGIVALS